VSYVFRLISPLEEMMKPRYLTRTLLGVLAVFTLLAALISPIPAYAKTSGGHEPPPPKPPSNDFGSGGKPGSAGKPSGKSDGSSSAAAGSPAGPGTPRLLAARLSVDALEPRHSSLNLPEQVMFCPLSSPTFSLTACQQKSTIEEMITYIKGLDDASGVIYVDQNYSTGLVPPQPGLVFDQSTFTGAGPLLVTDLTMQGGIDYSLGTQTATKTVLNQPVTVQNFNALSKVSLDMFQFNVSGYVSGDPATAAVNVVSSNHVSLTDLFINETGTGSGLVVTQSNDLTLQRLSVLDSAGGTGVSISQTSKIQLDQVGSTSTSKTGYGAFFTNNSDTLTINNSQFNGNTNDGLFVLNQTGDISLNGVNAAGNTALGAAFLLNSGALTILNSDFDNNTKLIAE